LLQEALAPGLSHSIEASGIEPEPLQIRPLVNAPEEQSAPCPEDGLLAVVLGDQPKIVTGALQVSPCGGSQQPGSPVHEPSTSPQGCAPLNVFQYIEWIDGQRQLNVNQYWVWLT
jgi:hypothetical protein